MRILTLNCRRFSVQYQLFDWNAKTVLATGKVERVFVGDSFITHQVPGKPVQHWDEECSDHRGALQLILKILVDPKIGVLDHAGRIDAVGHRVAHGGEKFTRSVLIDDRVTAAIEETAELAPLHNVPNLAGIRAALELLPDLPQVAIFDTAFHQTMPEAAYIYPVPYEWYQKYGVRRYGFHGQSHQYASRRGAALIGRKPEDCSIITVHTGNGVSLCAVKNGVSIDTSMGLTPLEGTMMGTRCGDIDAGIPPFMMNAAGISSHELDLFLNQKSGVAGIVGRNVSRRVVLQEAIEGDERCRLAVEMECYRLKKYLGSFIAVTGKIDAIVFTYTQGWEDWPVRGMALREMEQFGIKVDLALDYKAVQGGEMQISAEDSRIKVFAVPSGEVLMMNEDVASLLNWDREASVGAAAAI